MQLLRMAQPDMLYVDHYNFDTGSFAYSMLRASGIDELLDMGGNLHPEGADWSGDSGSLPSTGRDRDRAGRDLICLRQKLNWRFRRCLKRARQIGLAVPSNPPTPVPQQKVKTP